MPRYIRVGNRVINLELLVNCEFIRKESANNRSMMILYFSNSDAGVQLYGEEAEQVWHLVSHGALNVTPIETMKQGVIAS